MAQAMLPQVILFTRKDKLIGGLKAVFCAHAILKLLVTVKDSLIVLCGLCELTAFFKACRNVCGSGAGIVKTNIANMVSQ